MKFLILKSLIKIPDHKLKCSNSKNGNKKETIKDQFNCSVTEL